jgi:hypothetical protein
MFFILLHGVQQVALYTVSLPVAHPMKTKKSTCSTEDAKKIWRCERGDHHSNSVPDRGRPLPEIDGKVKYSNKNPSAVYDMPAIEALNSVSSNPILLFTCRLHEQRRGDITPPPPPGPYTAPNWAQIYFTYTVLIKIDATECI